MTQTLFFGKLLSILFCAASFTSAFVPIHEARCKFTASTSLTTSTPKGSKEWHWEEATMLFKRGKSVGTPTVAATMPTKRGASLALSGKLFSTLKKFYITPDKAQKVVNAVSNSFQLGDLLLISIIGWCLVPLTRLIVKAKYLGGEGAFEESRFVKSKTYKVIKGMSEVARIGGIVYIADMLTLLLKKFNFWQIHDVSTLPTFVAYTSWFAFKLCKLKGFSERRFVEKNDQQPNNDAQRILLNDESITPSVLSRGERVAVLVDAENVSNVEVVKNLMMELDRIGVIPSVQRLFGKFDRYSALKPWVSATTFPNDLESFDLIETEGHGSTDIQLAVDAMAVLHQYHNVKVFVLVSSDSDFIPLITALKKADKRVVVIGRSEQMTKCRSLVKACDQFADADKVLGSLSAVGADESLPILDGISQEDKQILTEIIEHHGDDTTGFVNNAFVAFASGLTKRVVKEKYGVSSLVELLEGNDTFRVKKKGSTVFIGKQHSASLSDEHMQLLISTIESHKTDDPWKNLGTIAVRAGLENKVVEKEYGMKLRSLLVRMENSPFEVKVSESGACSIRLLPYEAQL